ncbi:MAG: cytochrome c1, partial [Alphaproteobacteria bacterium]|nr:cytochrome c1 [Alphaproteobacteria bacterium]
MVRMRELVLAGALAFGIAGTAGAAEAPKPPAQSWSFEGIFGTFDRAALQRGYQVYKEVCAGCHALNQIRYRDLGGGTGAAHEPLVGLGFSEAEVKAIAAEYTVMDGPNDDGEMFERPARPADRLRKPFPNEKAA